MKLAEFEFVYNNDLYGTTYMCDKEESAFCADGVLEVLRRVFKLPKKPPKRLWLILYSRGTPFREKLWVEEIRSEKWESKESRMISSDGSWFVNDSEADDLLEPFIGKIVYLQVEYEE